MDKVTSFEQLYSWQKSAELCKDVYTITKSLPTSEKFALIDQMQRSVVSVSANIAEGFGRSSKAEKLQFYNIAYGSLLETKSHLLIADKIGYLDIQDHITTMQLITDVQKLINASRRALNNG